MKKTLFISLFIIISYFSYSQIGGISASKLATLCTTTVPAKSLEFEPAFSSSFSNKVWTSDGTSATYLSDSIATESDFGFRFSYGAIKNLEIGIALPIDVSTISYGMKYKLPFENKFSLGLLSGFNFILGNQIMSKKNYTFENTPSYVGGLVTTYEFSDKFSIDADAQYQKYFQNILENHKNDLFLNMDIGYFVSSGIQLVTGFNYSTTNFETNDMNSDLLSLNLGITIERAENFIIVINSPIDLIGHNTLKTNGFGFALTIMID